MEISEAQLLLFTLATVMIMRIHNLEEEIVRKHECVDVLFQRHKCRFKES